MYKDDYEYKRYKEEYDAYEDEKQELIKELKKGQGKEIALVAEKTRDLKEVMIKIKNEKNYDFLVVTNSDFIFAVKRINNVDQFDLYKLDRYIKTFTDRFEMLDFIKSEDLIDVNVDSIKEKLTSS